MASPATSWLNNQQGELAKILKLQICLHFLIDAFDLQYAGIPGCAKSALCKELLNAPGGLGDDRPVHSLMGDLIKGMGYYAAISVCYVPPSVYVHTHTHTEFILLAFSVHTTSQSGSSHFNLVAHPK